MIKCLQISEGTWLHEKCLLATSKHLSRCYRRAALCCCRSKEVSLRASRRVRLLGDTNQLICHALIFSASQVPNRQQSHKSSWQRCCQALLPWRDQSLWVEHDLLGQEQRCQALDLWIWCLSCEDTILLKLFLICIFGPFLHWIFSLFEGLWLDLRQDSSLRLERASH